MIKTLIIAGGSVRAEVVPALSFRRNIVESYVRDHMALRDVIPVFRILKRHFILPGLVRVSEDEVIREVLLEVL